MSEAEWNALGIALAVPLWALAIALWLPPEPAGRFWSFFRSVFLAIASFFRKLERAKMRP